MSHRFVLLDGIRPTDEGKQIAKLCERSSGCPAGMIINSMSNFRPEHRAPSAAVVSPSRKEIGNTMQHFCWKRKSNKISSAFRWLSSSVHRSATINLAHISRLLIHEFGDRKGAKFSRINAKFLLRAFLKKRVELIQKLFTQICIQIPFDRNSH